MNPAQLLLVFASVVAIWRANAGVFEMFGQNLNEETSAEHFERAESILFEHRRKNLETFRRGPEPIPRWAQGEAACAVLFKHQQAVSSAFQARGYQSLLHMTTIENAASILRTGFILTGDKNPNPPKPEIGMKGNIPWKVFTDLTKRDRPNSNGDVFFFWNPQMQGNRSASATPAVYFVLDLALLDESEFHISFIGAQWLHGIYTPEIDFHFRLIEKVHRFLDAIEDDQYRMLVPPGEVVHYDDVSVVKYLKEIWIHPDHVQAFLDAAQNLGIGLIRDRPIKDFIRVASLLSNNAP